MKITSNLKNTRRFPTVYKITPIGKESYIYTGSYHKGYRDVEPRTIAELRFSGNTVEEIKTPVVQLSLKVTGTVRVYSTINKIAFEEVNTKHTYIADLPGFIDIMKSIENSTLTIKNQSITGLFSFKKKSKKVYVYPLEEDAIKSLTFSSEAVDLTDAISFSEQELFS